MATPTLTELIQSFLEYRLSDVHTALPARIIKYEADQQKASVQPLIKKQYQDGTVESNPIITGVPVIFPSGGGALLSFPIQPGDLVLLVFSERSLDNWVASTGQEVEPNDSRKHDFSDAIAIPGLFTFAKTLNADPDAVVLKFNSGSIKIKTDGSVEINAAQIKLSGNVMIEGNVSISGKATSNNLDLTTHIHAELQSGFTGPPINSGS